MATTTYRTTLDIDEQTAHRLKHLAARWHVSQAEVVRRSLEKSEQADAHLSDIEKRIDAARCLRENLHDKISPEEWINIVQEARR